MRDYIHVTDLAAAHVLALEALIAEPRASLTMNCGYGRGYLGARSARRGRPGDQRGDRAPARRRAARATRRSLVADNRQILAALPWRPRRDALETIVADALAWERKLAERG